MAAILFNAMWDYARHGHRLLYTASIPSGAKAISPRFRLALAWIGTGTLLGALLHVLGMAVIAAFIPFSDGPSLARSPARRLRATSADLPIRDGVVYAIRARTHAPITTPRSLVRHRTECRSCHGEPLAEAAICRSSTEAPGRELAIRPAQALHLVEPRRVKDGGKGHQQAP